MVATPAITVAEPGVSLGGFLGHAADQSHGPSSVKAGNLLQSHSPDFRTLLDFHYFVVLPSVASVILVAVKAILEFSLESRLTKV